MRGYVVVEIVLSINNFINPLTKPLAEEVFKYYYKTVKLMHIIDWL